MTYFQLFFPVLSNSFRTDLVTDTSPNQRAYICLFSICNHLQLQAEITSCFQILH